jgi:hypothetical protein
MEVITPKTKPYVKPKYEPLEIPALMAKPNLKAKRKLKAKKD